MFITKKINVFKTINILVKKKTEKDLIIGIYDGPVI